MALYGKTTLKTIQEGLDNRKPFKVGNVSGEWTKWPHMGQLPGYLQDQLNAVIKMQDQAFVVYSYSTPIAWLTIEDEWYIPDVRYNSTTTGHQSRIRVMAHNPGFYTRMR